MRNWIVTIKFIWITSGICLLLWSTANGEEPLTFDDTAKITQDQYLELLEMNHPVFEKEHLSSEIERQQRISLTGAEDWDFFSSVNISHIEPAIAYASPETTDAFQASAGVQRIFWKTGGRFSASYETEHVSLDIDPLYGIPDSYYKNQVTISYSHPLLKNKHGYLDRLEYNLKKFDIDFSEIEAEENLENFLTASAERFLDWVFLSEEIKYVQQRLKLSEEELERTNEKRKSFLVDEVDVIRNKEAVQLWKQNLVSVKARWLALQAELAVHSQTEKLYSSFPDFNLYAIGSSGTLKKEIAMLESNSRLLRLLNTRKEQLECSLAGLKEAKKADLSVYTEINIKEADEKAGTALGMDKPDAYVGLRWSIPWTNTTVRAQLTKTELMLKQLEKEIEHVRIDLVSALSNLYIQRTELEEILELNQEHIRVAEQRTEEEIMLYNQGRGDMTFIIQSRDNVKNAQLTYAANALMYQKLKLQITSLLDQFYIPSAQEDKR